MYQLDFKKCNFIIIIYSYWKYIYTIYYRVPEMPYVTQHVQYVHTICNGILYNHFIPYVMYVVPESIRKFEILLSMEGYTTGDILCISKKYMKFEISLYRA